MVYSRKTGVWTAVGIALANVIHITYNVIVLTFIISVSETAFTVIKFLGIIYLIYLGIKTFSIKVKTEKEISESNKDITPFQAAKTGFITNILSVKASLFFASFFTMLMAVNSPLWAIIVLWIAMPLNSFIMASILSIFFTQNKIKNIYSKYQNTVNKLLGLILILLAIIIAIH